MIRIILATFFIKWFYYNQIESFQVQRLLFNRNSWEFASNSYRPINFNGKYHKHHPHMINSEKNMNENELRLISFNILAPCYNKITLTTPITTLDTSNNNDQMITNKRFESDSIEKYLKRNNRICDELILRNADLVCVQEYWTQCGALKELFETRLSNKYQIKELQRTSHWRDRDDGLAVFVNKERLLLLDSKDILFHDCGDRVAQLLLLGIKSRSIDSVNEIDHKYKYFICVNTHLLFPHNEYSTKIRVREMTKILDFVEAYRQTDLCQSVCGRSDVRVPVIIAGKFTVGSY